MKNEMNKEDELLRTLFRQHVEKPESTITEKVMTQIDQASEVFEYTPLISKKTWIIIAVLFIGACIYSLFQSEGMTLKTPELVNIFSDGLSKLRNGFQFDWSLPQLPQVSTPLLVSLVAFNVIGVYLMIYYRLSRRI